MKVKELEAA